MSDQPKTQGDPMATLRQALEQTMLFRLAMVAAAVGAVGALVSLFQGPPDLVGDRYVPEIKAEALKVRFCHPDFEDPCLWQEDLMDPSGEAVLKAGLPDRAITMVHPTDFSLPSREVTRCETYRTLSEAGWSGLTSADLRRQARFNRVCGLLALAAEARAVEGMVPLDKDIWGKLDVTTLPRLGELGFSPDDLGVTSEEQVYELRSGPLEGQFIYIATADFDSDQQAEYMFEWTVFAAEGTAQASGFGFLIRKDDGTAMFRIIDPFAFQAKRRLERAEETLTTGAIETKAPGDVATKDGQVITED